MLQSDGLIFQCLKITRTNSLKNWSCNSFYPNNSRTETRFTPPKTTKYNLKKAQVGKRKNIDPNHQFLGFILVFGVYNHIPTHRLHIQPANPVASTYRILQVLNFNGSLKLRSNKKRPKKTRHNDGWNKKGCLTILCDLFWDGWVTPSKVKWPPTRAQSLQ